MQSANRKTQLAGLAYLINRIQSLFVSLLRIWTIPIVLMLSVSSGFTTFYGLSHFIIPWIALIITIAIQSIIVICSLEIASIHWQANRVRYLAVMISLAVALAASIVFSYFKFYEVSERDNLHAQRLNSVRQEIGQYTEQILAIKSSVVQAEKQALDHAAAETSEAYFGTHRLIAPNFRNQVGEGPFWRHYNQIYQEKKRRLADLEQLFGELDQRIRMVQTSLNGLDVANDVAAAYGELQQNQQDMQVVVNRLAGMTGISLPAAPLLMTYRQFTEDVKPAFSMFRGFSWFAFSCAAMVDFFTVLLSYRLEFTAPGPLTAPEEELVFDCLRQFSEFRINANDELEMSIEKTELEKARRHSDWSRMFIVGLLLNRGFLRKVDSRTVEFAPQLYPLVADKMSAKIAELKARTAPAASP